ncbi:pentatricopeptide repeat-containing protein At4g32450, mitochondrial-like [Salvia splendens]|uniref:pentatricopeptide repeat-containing protein At4g32450, mitochondrial-like n=1 Tax=Salvia splendens TaxID=180675 RepID=UPI001C27DF06|nr:pentatricopeptide repeat-containing protein At4g32450, mitochondrial-like [Salvia splendens]
MYTRRAAVFTLTSLRRAIKVCRRNSSDFSCSVEIPNFARSFRAGAETADVYNNFDGDSAEYQSGYVNFNRNDHFSGRSSGGIEQNQNPSRVYGQIGAKRLNLSDSYGNGSGGVRNQSGYNSSSFDSRNHGRSFGGQMGNGTFQQNVSSNGGGLDATPLNHGGGRLENSRGGSYGGRADMQVKNGGDYGVHPQNVAGSYHFNSGNYQRTVSESQSGVVTDFGVSTDLSMNAESRATSKLDDLDQLTRGGKVKEAVELLELLEKERVRVGIPRFMALVKSCGENEALAEAKSVHKHLLKTMAHLEVRMYNQIIEMYSKCGSMEDAFAVFDQMPERNLTSWDIMISWLAKNGHGEESLELFAEFKQSGLRPDGQMFLGVFSACGVISDVVEGMLHFESMTRDYGVVPGMEHYAGIVDMLGTAGCVDEAMEFIQSMPVEPSVEIWETLLKFCRIHGNVVLGDQCAELVQLLDPTRLNEQSRAGLIPLSASDMNKEKEKKKSTGQGPLDVRHRVHEYRAGDRSHPDNERLYGLLRALKQHMKEVGYIPEIRCVLHDVDHETKEEALMAHSERLAAAHGFLTSPARASIRIIKNLRVCTDCHNVFKIISKIVGREIVARDSKRFHHFRDGSCSCNDFW